MPVFKDVDFDYLYEFCLDWQMGMVPREELEEEFSMYNWNFFEFKAEAKKYNYWVESMSILENI